MKIFCHEFSGLASCGTLGEANLATFELLTLKSVQKKFHNIKIATCRFEPSNLGEMSSKRLIATLKNISCEV